MMETFFNVSQQTRLFLLSCVTGACLGVVFDFLRVFRIIIKHKKSVVFVEDFLFILFFMLTVFTFSTEAVRGELRFFVFLGAFLGFVIYILTVGTVVVYSVSVILEFIYKILFAIYRIFISPVLRLFVHIYQKIKTCFVNNCKSFSQKAQKSKKRLKPVNNMVYNNSTYQQAQNKRGEKHNGRKNRKVKKAKKITAGAS